MSPAIALPRAKKAPRTSFPAHCGSISQPCREASSNSLVGPVAPFLDAEGGGERS